MNAALPQVVAPEPSASASGFGLIRRFFAWWRGELSALVPKAVKRFLRPTPPPLLAQQTADDLTLERRLRRRSRHFGALEEVGARQMRRLRRDVAKRRLQVVLAAPAGRFATRALSLPLAVERELDRVLFYEINRATPFEPSELYYAYEVKGRRPATGKLDIELVYAVRSAIDPLLEALERQKLPAARLDVLGKGGKLRGLNLLPRQRKPGVTFARLLTATLLVSGAVLAASWAALALAQKELSAEALRDAAFTARRAAIAIQDRRDAAVERTDALSVAYAMKQERPMAVAVLARITEILPDDTWLETLRMSGAEVQMTGVSADATSLIGLFERHESFTAPEFRAPITREGGDGLERFALSVKLAATEAAQ